MNLSDIYRTFIVCSVTYYKHVTQYNMFSSQCPKELTPKLTKYLYHSKPNKHKKIEIIAWILFNQKRLKLDKTTEKTESLQAYWNWITGYWLKNG